MPNPDSVLQAWTTLEVLAPQPLPNEQGLTALRRHLIRLEDVAEPWREKRFGRKGKERAVFWMVYLGELDLAKAVESILKIFPDEAADERTEARGTTTLAVVVLDGDGLPVRDKTFLSSFAWGYGRVRAGQLKELAAFAEAEQAIKTEIENRILRQDEDGNLKPVTSTDINGVVDWLISALNLPQEEVIRPGIAVRVPQWGWAKEAPEPELLNSFFIEDLVQVRKALASGNVGKALSAYMSANSPFQRKDIVRDRALLKETVSPGRIPLIRWPGPGRHPLVLMQQAAVNHAVSELSDGGLVGINGPPGTGKTTLLRDIVAKVVLDRAIAMAGYDKPESAFKHVTTMKTGRAYSHLYQLDDILLGHEIVVASSNNKAVENISREIPSSTAIADDFTPPLRYFRSISDAVAAGDGEIIEGATWGLTAAVLGNAANRAAFTQAFWWHKQRGLAQYLRIVTGKDPLGGDDDDGDEDGKSTIPEVIAIEKPPLNEVDALNRWRTARKDFRAKLKTAQHLQKETEKAYEAAKQIVHAKKRVKDATLALATARERLAAAEVKASTARRLYERRDEAERTAVEDRTATDRLRPGFFARLFRTRSYRTWRQQMSAAIERVSDARTQKRNTADALEKSQRELGDVQQGVAQAQAEKAKLDCALKDLSRIVEVGRQLIGKNFADDAFWDLDETEVQTASPWMYDTLQRARDELFVAAFGLHRAFIDAAAKPLRHNLRAAINLIGGRSLTDKQESVRRSLWASLFLVVPVVSTTFASVSKLFGRLGREQLGWLLIDEAGQAVPQAAVGAVWRAKRAVVIGDPLQIEPVVSTPPRLIKTIFAEFGVSTEEWAAPEVSAQTLADRMSWFGTTISSDDGEMWVGSPLRVHRRCEEPMFSIANHIAYDGLMVYGTRLNKSEIGSILGESIWINVDGSDAVGKWSPEEGSIALQILHKLFESGVNDPDIFFITPFRIVSHKLRELIQNDTTIRARLRVPTWEWIVERVGTVHTFQGKEADSVVLVLGASLDTSAGARRWAGHSPNLLNVAVTRAKRRLYVVGNRKAWKQAGVFSHLARSIPVLGQRPTAETEPESEITTKPIPGMPYSGPQCVFCGQPSIVGENVCYQCKGD